MEINFHRVSIFLQQVLVSNLYCFMIFLPFLDETVIANLAKQSSDGEIQPNILFSCFVLRNVFMVMAEFSHAYLKIDFRGW
ncbi:MAG: hypothetical protein FWD91_02950 [Treponema sp.]|nr:hypothetical protein [Treponema sp.]